MLLRCIIVVIISSLTSFYIPEKSIAAECKGSTCIDVTTDGRQEILITVRKKSPGTSATTNPSIRPSPFSKPRTVVKRPWIPWLPKPVVKRSATPRPRKSSTVTRISGSAVMDQVRSLIPRGVITTQPNSNYLVHQPVTFRTNLPPRFVANVVVLRIPIEIELEATFIWNFGDGHTLVTKEPGAPYPLSTIRNTYSNSGRYTAQLEVRWSGAWRASGISAPITGSIIQSYTRDIYAQPALAHFTR